VLLVQFESFLAFERKSTQRKLLTTKTDLTKWETERGGGGKRSGGGATLISIIITIRVPPKTKSRMGRAR
jgi:hypothetical protein